MAIVTTTQKRSVATSARSIRLQRRLTLDQLAATTALSKGHLSRFERGEKTLSMAALLRLSQALSVPVSLLLGESPVDDLLHFVPRDTRVTNMVTTAEGGYRFALLSRAAHEAGPEVFLLELRQGLATDAIFRADHGGRESLFVVTGEVEVDIAGHIVKMIPGDYLEFPGRNSHRLRSLSETSEILAIVR